MKSDKVYYTTVFGGHKLIKWLLYLRIYGIITIAVKNNEVLNNCHNS